MLFKQKEFLEGEITLLKINEDKNKSEILSIYMEKRSYEEIISFITNEKNLNDKLYINLALDYFSSPQNRKSKNGENEKEINELMDKYLKLLLDNIIEKKLLIPIKVLDILKKSNPNISIKLIKTFIEKSFKINNEPIEKNKELINKLNEDLQKTKNEINELKTKSFILRNNINCPECGLSISFPSVYFFCNHTYHSLCLNANVYEDIECNKCKEKRIKLINNIFKERESINNKNKFQDEINNKGFYSLYGKGIMEFKK
jgi:hypothetical protein